MAQKNHWIAWQCTFKATSSFFAQICHFFLLHANHTLHIDMNHLDRPPRKTMRMSSLPFSCDAAHFTKPHCASISSALTKHATKPMMGHHQSGLQRGCPSRQTLLNCAVNTDKNTSRVTNWPLVNFHDCRFHDSTLNWDENSQNCEFSSEDWVVRLTVTKIYQWSVCDTKSRLFAKVKKQVP